MTVTTFGTDQIIAWCGLAPTPRIYFYLVAIHHALSMSLVIPMNASYAALRDYHLIAFSLLAAASICYTLNAWKMTLDVTKRKKFAIFKAILAIRRTETTAGGRGDAAAATWIFSKTGAQIVGLVSVGNRDYHSGDAARHHSMDARICMVHGLVPRPRDVCSRRRRRLLVRRRRRGGVHEHL